MHACSLTSWSTYPATSLFSPLKCLIHISNLYVRNGSLHLQLFILNSFSSLLTPFCHNPYPISQQILLVLFLKYIQNLTILYHFYYQHTGISHYHYLSIFLSSPCTFSSSVNTFPIYFQHS